jgi:cytoskeletal protein RodZ
MVSKDQGIGGLICLVCVVVGVFYTLGLFYWGYWLLKPRTWTLAFTLVAIPVFVAFIAILAIGAWIGWTMATTPPPKPIEDITSEMETEKTKTEEKPASEEAKPTTDENQTSQENTSEQPAKSTRTRSKS